MPTFSCAKGHVSTEPDFCSECGAKMRAAPICPDCGATASASDVTFCEVCGYNFQTHAHGEIPMVPLSAKPQAAPEQPVEAPPPPPPPPPDPVTVIPPPTETAKGWRVEVTVDPTLREAGSPPAPADPRAITIELKSELNLIGRTSQSRAIYPEIPLDSDDAVSHRHALLSRDSGGKVILRDIGSANGTRLNGRDVQPLTDVVLHDGDELTLGHWTRLAIKAMR